MPWSSHVGVPAVTREEELTERPGGIGRVVKYMVPVDCGGPVGKSVSAWYEC